MIRRHALLHRHRREHSQLLHVRSTHRSTRLVIDGVYDKRNGREFLNGLLVRDVKFRSTFANVLSAAINELGDRPLELSSIVQAQIFRDEPGDGVASLLLQAVRNKKYSKERVAQVLSSVSGKARWLTDADSMTLSELVGKFAKTASDIEVSEVLRKLGTIVSRDPFLGGIGARKSK